MHPDTKYITYLQKRDSKGVDKIYQQFAGKVKRMIMANSGSEEEGADVFQEALIDIFKLSLKKDFELTCSFEAFLIIVCKRKWLTILKSSRKKRVTKREDILYTYEKADDAEAYATQIERENTLLSLVDELSAGCRDIIKACMTKKPLAKVAEQLGISYAYLRKRKSICMGNLSKLVKEHPLFKS